MSKIIEIEYINDKYLSQLEKAFDGIPFVKKVTNNKKESIISVEYEESKDNYLGVGVISAISIALCMDYASFYSKYKNNKDKVSIILSTLTTNTYYTNALLIQLLAYFQSNSKLKEKIFFQFNMGSFPKELDYIIEDYEYESIIEAATKEVKGMLKTNNVNIKKYSTLEVCFDDDGCIYLQSKNDDILTLDNLAEKTGLDLDFDLDGVDDFAILVAFFDFVIVIFEVKKIIFPQEAFELYLAVKEQVEFSNKKVELVLKN
jgi:hypothetical protein